MDVYAQPLLGKTADAFAEGPLSTSFGPCNESAFPFFLTKIPKGCIAGEMQWVLCVRGRK